MVSDDGALDAMIDEVIAANPKSAALRKTSKNNPINKAKRAAHRKNRNHEGDE